MKLTVLKLLMFLIIGAFLTSCESTKFDTPDKRYSKAQKAFETTDSVTKSLIKYKKISKETAKPIHLALNEADKYLKLWGKALKNGEDSASFELKFKLAMDSVKEYNGRTK